MRSIALACCVSVIAAPAFAQIVRVSVSSAGVEANGPSGPPSISSSGRFVVFASAATNLVTGDTNALVDIFLRDRDTDADGIFDEPAAVATTRVSLGPSSAQPDAASSAPVISADGRYVAFVSTASNLAAGANGLPQVYRVDRTTGNIVRVSESVSGDAGDADSGAPAISADGDVVAFQSRATNLVTDAGSALLGVFVREITADRNTRISPLAQVPGPNTGTAYVWPTISDNGVRVAYQGITVAVGGSAFVFDRTTGVTQLATESGDVRALAISGSGLEVIWRTSTSVARRAIDSGAALKTMQEYVRVTSSFANA